MSSLVITTIIFIVTANLTLYNTTAHPLDKEAMREERKKLISSCKEKTGASEADFQTLLSHKMPESHEGLCMLECVFDTTKMMENGKFSKNGFVNAFKPLVGDDESKQKGVEDLASTCEQEIGDSVEDKCQTAKLLVECIVNRGNSSGLSIPESG